MEINIDREMSASPSKLIAEAELQAIEQSRPRRTHSRSSSVHSRSSSVHSRSSSVRSRPDSALALVLERQMDKQIELTERQMEMQRGQREATDRQTECQTQLMKLLIDGQLGISRRLDNIESSPRGSPILGNNVSGSSKNPDCELNAVVASSATGLPLDHPPPRQTQKSVFPEHSNAPSREVRRSERLSGKTRPDYREIGLRTQLPVPRISDPRGGPDDSEYLPATQVQKQRPVVLSEELPIEAGFNAEGFESEIEPGRHTEILCFI